MATVLLAEWHLTSDNFDGDTLLGPVPRLFAASPTEARTAIMADAAKAFKDVQRIHARFLASENVPAEEAWDYVGNPR